MYFWRILKLRNYLKNNTLSTKESLHYVLAVTLFYMILCLIFSTAAHFAQLWHIVLFIALFFITKFIGIPICYVFNKADEGENFMQRYFTMAWVMIIRLTVFGTIILALLLVVVSLLFGLTEFKSPHYIIMGLFLLIWQILFYIRMVHHFQQLQ